MTNFLNTAARTLSTRRMSGNVPVRQTERLDASQEKNNAGGFSFVVDDWTRLRRWLIIGSEGGTYYVSEAQLTKENADVVLRCLKADGPRTVREILSISESGRTPKNELCIFALALASAFGDEETRGLAHYVIPGVCRTGTHLFQFADFVDGLRSWGSGLKKGVSAWYENKTADQLAYQVIKYRQREQWTHRDILRSAHPKATTVDHSALYDYICGRGGSADGIKAIAAYEQAKQSSSPEETVRLIREYGNVLPREALKTEHLNSPVVWFALLTEGMPINALVRNLGNMSKAGILGPGSDGEKAVLAALGNKDAITRSKIHPINLMMALKVYAHGRGIRGGNEWVVNPQIIDALDAAFYLSFDNVEPTGKRRLIAIDNSASMRWSLSQIRNGNTPIPDFYAADASAAIALVSLATGDPVTISAFAADRMSRDVTSGIRPLAISARSRMDDVVQAMKNAPSGGTDCSLPMRWAETLGDDYDSFEVYTDNDTWAGPEHPMQSLRRYRETRVKDAKLVVFAMTPTRFSIADPKDAGSLDVVGFDPSAPAVVADFVAGRI